MSPVKIVFWQEEDGLWLGYLQDHPDYMTQGETLAKLKDNLKDIYETWIQEAERRYREYKAGITRGIP